MASEPARTRESIKFGGDLELDPISCELRRPGGVLKLERIPGEILLFLLEQRGKLVTREQIVEKIWGKDVFLDTDNSINGAIRKIRQVLKDDPERPRFIQTITGRGYRFIATAAEPVTEAPLQKAIAAEPKSTPLLPISKLGYRRWPLLLSVAVLALTVAGIWSLRPLAPRFQPASGRLMLAVLPFQNLTGDASQDYFSDGLTEEMLTQLGNLNPEHLGVIARTSVMHYKGTQAPLDQIGRELGVQYIIEGSVRRDAGRVRISAQLIQIKDQSHIWARQYDRELKDLLGLQSEIAQEIIDEIQLTLGDRTKVNIKRRITSAPASNEAYDLYLKGLYFWNKRSAEGFQQARECFQQASAKDPNYARAYAGLANTLGLMSVFGYGPQNELMPKARAAALEALQRDAGLAEAHTALGLVAEDYDYDWQTADKEFRRAIELDSNYATAHQWYGEYLSWQGRFNEALAESERARQLDPMSLIIASDHGAILYRARQYDRAIAQLRAVLEMDPSFCHACGYLVTSYIREGRFREALDAVNRYVRPLSKPWALSLEPIIYGEWGREAEAEKAFAKFEDADRTDSEQYKKALLFAYIGMGRKDQAMAMLEKFFVEHSPLISTLKTEPVYDPLRSDPRFQGLLRRAGLAQ